MLFSKALGLSEMEGIYHASYRPGTVDMPTSGKVDASKLPRSLVGFWPLDSDDNFNRATNFHGAGACVHHTGSCAELTAVNAEFVTGLFGQAVCALSGRLCGRRGFHSKPFIRRLCVGVRGT